MNFLNRVWRWLTQGRQRNARKAHPDLNPYDVARLVEDLNLKAEARRLGEAGVPAPGATRPGGAEAEAIQRVDRVRQDYVDWAAVRLSVLNERLEKTDVTQTVNRARQADQEFERKASSLITEQDAVLRATGERARQLDAELRAFKSGHGLNRRAVYPTGARAFFGYALLLFLVVLEGVLNASFFAQGVDSGLLGGAAYAMALAALNVAIAYGLGRWPSRFLHHRRSGMKVFGWGAVLAALVGMVVVGLSIAHFRDALTAGSTEAPAAAMHALMNTPLVLKDLLSWGLFGISVVFALIAFFDGHFSDDLYPGYGKVSRRADEAAEAYESELQALRTGLDELREQEVKALDAAAKDSQASVVSFATTIEDKRSAKLKFEAALQDSSNSLEAVLLIFRQENEVARKGLPRPTYFDQPPQLAPLNLPDFGTQADEERLATQRVLAEKLLAEVQEIRGRIQAAFNQKFDLLKPLPQHFEVDEGKG
jgi:hypothetical protein